MVDVYFREMVLGNWRVTGQGISLDDEGILVDGQHRMTALVRFGSPVWMMVARGVPHETAIQAIDSGPSRSAGQRLTMQGEKNGARRAAIARGAFVLSNPDASHTGMIPHSDIVFTLNRYRESIEVVDQGRASERIPSTTRAVAVVMLDAVPEYGADFAEGISSGANLGPGDPRLALRNWLNTRTGRVTGEELWTRSILAADAFMNDEKIHKLMGSARNRYIRFARNLGLQVNQSLLTALSR